MPIALDAPVVTGGWFRRLIWDGGAGEISLSDASDTWIAIKDVVLGGKRCKYALRELEIGLASDVWMYVTGM